MISHLRSVPKTFLHCCLDLFWTRWLKRSVLPCRLWRRRHMCWATRISSIIRSSLGWNWVLRLREEALSRAYKEIQGPRWNTNLIWSRMVRWGWRFFHSLPLALLAATYGKMYCFEANWVHRLAQRFRGISTWVPWRTARISRPFPSRHMTWRQKLERKVGHMTWRHADQWLSTLEKGCEIVWNEIVSPSKWGWFF